MWQVFLYLANERQVRERHDARVAQRARRWAPGRRGGVAAPSQARDETAGGRSAQRAH